MAWEVWNRMKSAAIAARRAFLDPTMISTAESSMSGRESIYLERWAYANSSAYDDLDAWASRYSTSGMYVKTRGIYNPVGRNCEFWQSAIYPGMIPQGDASLPSGAREALPMAPGINPDLRACILQTAQWTNFQTQKDQLTYLGAALGDVGQEIVDDTRRGKVAFKLWWPGFVKSIEIDDYENVQFVRLEYLTGDGDETYMYRQEMSKDSFATFKDDRPFAYDDSGDSERPNPYGFVPFNWVRHYPLLGKFSEPAMRSTAKLDMLNSTVSRTLDYIKTRQKAPFGIAAEWDSRGLGDIDVAARRTNTETDEYGSNVVVVDTDDAFILALPAGATGLPLSGNIEPEQSIAFIDRMLAELEADNPELNAFAKLREMSSVSGVAIERALGDTVGRVRRAQAAYDQQVVKAFQMAVAIGGWRYNLGSWERTTATEKFAPFGLDSYDRGELDFMLLEREFVKPTQNERFEAANLKYASISAATAAGLPLKAALVEAGYSEEDADEIVMEEEQKDARAMNSLLAARTSALRPLQLPPGNPEVLPPVPANGNGAQP